MQAATGPACHSIREAIVRIGPRSLEPDTAVIAPKPPEQDVLEEVFQTRDDESLDEAESESEKSETEWFFLFIDKEYERSLSLIRERISSTSDDEDVAALESWAAAIQYRIDPKLGRADFEEVFEKYPTNSLPYNLLARYLMQVNEHTECLRILETGITEAEEKASLLLVRFLCFEQMGNDLKAIETLRDAISEYPYDDSFYDNLARHYVDRENYSEARSCLEEGLSKLSESRSLLTRYARLLYDHFDKKLALIPYNRLLELAPDSPSCLTLRANIYLDLNLNDLALADYKRANELAEEKHAWILANIGNIFKNRGFYREGIEYLQRALALDPESQYAHERLAVAIKSRDDEIEKLDEIVKQARRDIFSDLNPSVGPH